MRANAEKRWNIRSRRKNQQKGEGENRHNYKGRKQRTSACLINCLECDVPVMKKILGENIGRGGGIFYLMRSDFNQANFKFLKKYLKKFLTEKENYVFEQLWN